jgi:hypothetical protein
MLSALSRLSVRVGSVAELLVSWLPSRPPATVAAAAVAAAASPAPAAEPAASPPPSVGLPGGTPSPLPPAASQYFDDQNRHYIGKSQSKAAHKPAAAVGVTDVVAAATAAAAAAAATAVLSVLPRRPKLIDIRRRRGRLPSAPPVSLLSEVAVRSFRRAGLAAAPPSSVSLSSPPPSHASSDKPPSSTAAMPGAHVAGPSADPLDNDNACTDALRLTRRDLSGDELACALSRRRVSDTIALSSAASSSSSSLTPASWARLCSARGLRPSSSCRTCGPHGETRDINALVIRLA